MKHRTNGTMKSLRHSLRAALVAGLAAGLSATMPGCSTMKSPTQWFSKDEDRIAAAEEKPLSSSIADTGKGIAGQFKTMGTAVSSAMGKAKDAVTATFVSSDNPDDATSLANMPTKLEPEVWVANGQFFEAQGNYAKALDNYTQALEKQPDNEAALLSTARLYARQQQNTSAVEFFNKALEVNPKNASTHNELAVLLQAEGKNAEAQAAVAQAIALDPGNPRFRNNLAGMQVAVGRSDEAVSQLQQILSPAEANYNVAYLHFMNSNLASAQQHLEVALRTDPNLQRARTLLQRISETGAAQNAMAGFKTADEIYRTAQAIATPSQAGAAVFQQQPGSGTPAGTPGINGNTQAQTGFAAPQQFQAQPGSLGSPPNGFPTTTAPTSGSFPAGAPPAQTGYGSQPVGAPQTYSAPPVAPFLTGKRSGVPAMQVSTSGSTASGTVIQNQFVNSPQSQASQDGPIGSSSMPTMRSAQTPSTTSLLPPPATNRYNSPQ